MKFVEKVRKIYLERKRALFLQNLKPQVVVFCDEQSSFQLAVLNRFLSHKLDEKDIFVVKTSSDMERTEIALRSKTPRKLVLIGIFDNPELDTLGFLQKILAVHQVVASIDRLNLITFFNSGLPKSLLISPVDFSLCGLSALIKSCVGKEDRFMEFLFRCVNNSCSGDFDGDSTKRIHYILRLGGDDVFHRFKVFALKVSRTLPHGGEIEDWYREYVKIKNETEDVISQRTEPIPQVARVIVKDKIDYNLFLEILRKDHQFILLVVQGGAPTLSVFSRSLDFGVGFFAGSGIKTVLDYNGRVFINSECEDDVIKFLSRKTVSPM